MAKRLSVLDVNRCVGCQACMFACVRRLGKAVWKERASMLNQQAVYGKVLWSSYAGRAKTRPAHGFAQPMRW